MAELTEKALSQIVLPETMDDIEEYLKPQFLPKNPTKKPKDIDNEVHGRRIVMDGFGRWREIRPKNKIQSSRLELVNADNLPRMKQIFGMEDRVSSRNDSCMQKSRYEAYRSYGATKRYLALSFFFNSWNLGLLFVLYTPSGIKRSLI